MNHRYANPYVIGVLLGLVLLFSFYTMGRGVGSSASFARIAAAGVKLVAPEEVQTPAVKPAEPSLSEFKIVDDEGC